MFTNKILENHKRELIKEIENHCDYLEDNEYFDKYVVYELLELNSGDAWRESILGCASALDYVCKLLANRGC